MAQTLCQVTYSVLPTVNLATLFLLLETSLVVSSVDLFCVCLDTFLCLFKTRDFRFIDGIDKVDSEFCLICKHFFFQHKDISYNFFFLELRTKN